MKKSGMSAGTGTAGRPKIIVPTAVLAAVLLLAGLARGEKWSDASLRAAVQSPSLSVLLQGGLPIRIVNRHTGAELLDIPLAQYPQEVVAIADQDVKLDDLDVEMVRVEGRGETTGPGYHWKLPSGSRMRIVWEVAGDDVVVHVSAQTTEPTRAIYLSLPQCQLTRQRLIWVTNFGVAKIIESPFEGGAGSGEAISGYWRTHHYVHPLVALFESDTDGFVIEGRFKELAPAGVTFTGMGTTTNVVFRREYDHPTTSPQLYPIHIRGYKGDFRPAIDPYIQWLETGLGFVPLAKKQPPWIRDIRAQTYILPWESNPYDDRTGIENLEMVAGCLDPSQTLLGKLSEYRPRPKYGFDHYYPNYEPAEYARKFVQRARQMGFHTAFHVNTYAVDTRLTDLVERFKDGMRQIGTDEDGKPYYWGYGYPGATGYTRNNYGKVQFAWCSPALADFRRYLVGQLKPMIDAGADVVYLDESNTPVGRFEVDGVTAIEGFELLKREILAAYPGVALMVEQPNLYNLRHVSIAMTSHDFGHPLSPYIYGHFVKLTPWHGWVQRTDPERLERFMRMGFLVPSASTNEDWLKIAHAFQQYKLEPAPLLAVDGKVRFFGFKGDAVVAYYEKRNDQFGLAVYGPEDKQIAWLVVQVKGT